MMEKKIYFFFISLHMNHSVSGSFSAELIIMSVIVHSALWADVALFSVLSAARINMVHKDVLVNISLPLICI